MSESRESNLKAVMVLLEPPQLKHLELLVSRGKASSIEEALTRLIDRDRYADDTPLDGFFGKPGRPAEPNPFADDGDEKPSGGSFWDNL